MRVAKSVTLTVEERSVLTTWSRGRSTPARLVLRAKIVLASAEGRESKDIAAELVCTRRTVGTWRNRFMADRLMGIQQDAPRGGRAATKRASFEAEWQRSSKLGLFRTFGDSAEPMSRPYNSSRRFFTDGLQ
jgi:hypothetical protein